jgi:hypothetical protein
MTDLDAKKNKVDLRENIHLGKENWEALLEFPSIRFGVEMVFNR